MESSIPPSGSIVEGSRGDANVSIYCRVTLPNGMEQVTSWFVQREGSSSLTPVSTFVNEGSITIDGEVLGGFNFATNLTILSLTLDWHNTIFYCGISQNTRAGNFTIKIFSELQLHMTLMQVVISE